MKKLWCLLFLSLYSQISMAGDKVLNGGNVITCASSNGDIQTVELLDYYEVRLNGGILNLNPNLETHNEKLLDLFKRWEKVAPRRMALYTKWLNEFNQEAGIYSNINIPAIPDTGSIVIPNGCELKPVAFQRRDEDIFPGTKRYVINKDLWDLMDEEQKAGLVLHELIYREAIKAVNSTSHPTRYFNGYLSSEVPKSETYTHIVSQMPLEWVEYGGGMILKIGVVGCGGFGGAGCRFERKSVIDANGKSINAVITEIFDNVETDEVKIDFAGFNRKIDSKESKFKLESGKSISLYLGNSTRTFFIKEIYAKDLLHLNFINECEQFEHFSFSFFEMNTNRLEVGSHNDRSVPLDAHSWLMNSNNIRIENINGLSRGGRVIQTLSGRTWNLDPSANIYK